MKEGDDGLWYRASRTVAKKDVFSREEQTQRTGTSTMQLHDAGAKALDDIVADLETELEMMPAPSECTAIGCTRYCFIYLAWPIILNAI